MENKIGGKHWNYKILVFNLFIIVQKKLQKTTNQEERL